jgi:hypothetical protein
MRFRRGGVKRRKRKKSRKYADPAPVEALKAALHVDVKSRGIRLKRKLL